MITSRKTKPPSAIYANETRRGFTLLELLVVISIIALLIAVILPALSAARTTARRMSCASNLRQIGVALFSYRTDHEALPARMPGTRGDSPHVVAATPTATPTAELLYYTQTPQVFFCPDNFQDRGPDDWWPHPTHGTVAATYQLPFWLIEGAWLVTRPDYESELNEDMLLGSDYLAYRDVFRADPRVWNHGNANPDVVDGMNQLFGDGHVAWNNGDRGWTNFSPAGGLFWFWADW